MRNVLIRIVVAAGLAGILTWTLHFSASQFLAVAGMALLLISGFAALFPSDGQHRRTGGGDTSGRIIPPWGWGHGSSGQHSDSGSCDSGGGGAGGCDGGDGGGS